MIRGVVRLACLLLVLTSQAVLAQTTPQQPFSQRIELWTRQLDRISARIDQPNVLPAEIDTLREWTNVVRAEVLAAEQISRADLADTRRLLAPLEPRTGPDNKPSADQPPDTDAVKVERTRLTDLAAISESRVKQCEVVLVRIDQLLERMTKVRGQVVLQTLLHRNASPLSAAVWTRIGPQFVAASRSLANAFDTWAHNGLAALRSGDQDLLPLAIWAVVTIGLWWTGRVLRQRYGRNEDTVPGERNRAIAAAIDGLGLVLVPILAVWLVGRLLAASQPPPD
ncbi:MAG: DUF3772 domain-containing protein, partial [Proteobacteria bacterium]|nr:DUF3772 domain-containing protein [Pseudomonadota bacterium]